MSRGTACTMLMLSALLVAGVPAYALQPVPHDADSGHAVTVEMLAKPTALGERVHALVLDYKEALFGGAHLEAAFDVEVFVNSKSWGRRKVRQAYVSQAPVDLHVPGSGHYVVLRLDPRDENAATYQVRSENVESMAFRGRDADGSVATMSVKQPYKVPVEHGSALRYVVTQTRHLRAVSGRLLPAAVYEGTGDAVNHGVLERFVFGYHPDGRRQGNRMAYHLYRPGKDVRSPYLVVALHGSGQAGPDTIGPLVSSRLAVATLDHEDGYVLVPQYDGVRDLADAKGGVHWQTPNRRRLVLSLIDRVLAEHPEIDRSRIYLNGLSRGAEGALYLMQDRPNLFAGALLMSGREANTVEWVDGRATVASLAPLRKQPMWLFHAREDKVAPVEGSRINYRILKETLGNPHIRYTELSFKEPGDDGIINNSAHNTWDMVYDSPVVMDWLLKQRRTP